MKKSDKCIHTIDTTKCYKNHLYVMVDIVKNIKIEFLLKEDLLI